MKLTGFVYLCMALNSIGILLGIGYNLSEYLLIEICINLLCLVVSHFSFNLGTELIKSKKDFWFTVLSILFPFVLLTLISFVLIYDFITDYKNLS